jgi:flavodoxin
MGGRAIMRALVVYESIWGNTEAIARAAAAGVGGDAEVVAAVDAPAAIPDDVDLLIVGGPTHAFSMTTPSTRESARQQGATTIPARGIREWILELAAPSRAVRVATFDTRTVSPRLPGSAAKKAMKRLVARGLEPAAKPETFGVHGYGGPLADGEEARAKEWGAKLATAVAGR